MILLANSVKLISCTFAIYIANRGKIKTFSDSGSHFDTICAKQIRLLSLFLEARNPPCSHSSRSQSPVNRLRYSPSTLNRSNSPSLSSTPAMPSRNACDNFGVFVSWTIGAVIVLEFISIPIIFLVLEVLRLPKLAPAVCEIQKKLPNNFYDVFVTPNNAKKNHFTYIVEADREGFNNFTVGDKVKCFFSRQKGEDGIITTVQFHSDRRDMNIFTVVFMSIWNAIDLIVLLGFLFGATCYK